MQEGVFQAAELPLQPPEVGLAHRLRLLHGALLDRREPLARHIVQQLQGPACRQVPGSGPAVLGCLKTPRPGHTLSHVYSPAQPIHCGVPQRLDERLIVGSSRLVEFAEFEAFRQPLRERNVGSHIGKMRMRGVQAARWTSAEAPL